MQRVKTPLELRVEATQATLDRWRDTPFEPGTSDCVQIVLSHLRGLGRPVKYGIPLRYKTLIGGRAVLKRVGFKSLDAWMDSVGVPITPAMALVGDVLELQALEDEKVRGLAALVLYLGNGAVLGYHEAAVGACVMRIGEGVAPLRGWRLL